MELAQWWRSRVRLRRMQRAREARVDKVVQAVVDTVDPRMRGLSGYRRKLAPAIEHAARFDEVGNVGDVNVEPEAPVELGHGDGVVEVPCGFAVDGAGGRIVEPGPSRKFVGIDPRGESFGRLEHLRRKLQR